MWYFNSAVGKAKGRLPWKRHRVKRVDCHLQGIGQEGFRKIGQDCTAWEWVGVCQCRFQEIGGTEENLIGGDCYFEEYWGVTQHFKEEAQWDNKLTDSNKIETRPYCQRFEPVNKQVQITVTIPSITEEIEITATIKNKHVDQVNIITDQTARKEIKRTRVVISWEHEHKSEN